jgi:acyl dehydratase
MAEGLTLANAHEFVGGEFGITDWVFVDQMQTNVFGEVTRWRTPGHCDPVWAKENSPWGGTILHGFMAVSLLTHFAELTRPADARGFLNYGLDKVRVLSPLLIGDGVRLRSRVTLMEVTDKPDGCKLFKTGHLIEAEGEEKPFVYAEFLAYWYPPGYAA